MSKATDKPAAQANKQVQLKTKPPQAAPPQSSGPEQAGPLGGMRGGSVESQAAMLQRMPAGQQQAMLKGMGGSNSHIQRVVAAMRQGSHATVPALQTKRGDEEASGARTEGITATNGPSVVTPGSKVSYTMNMGPSISAPGSQVNYQWMCYNDQVAAAQLKKPEMVVGPKGPTWDATWGFPGVHRLVCQVQHVSSDGSKQEPQRFEYVQEVKAVADTISSQDIMYEMVAHHMAYKDNLDGEAAKLLTRWGFQPNWVSKINDRSTDFFCGLLMPDEEHPELMPIIAFRGTASYKGVVSDTHPGSVGSNQFNFNRDFVAQLIAEAGGRVDVTGHSLGGALAQHAAAAFTSGVRRVVTFQAPGITLSEVKKFGERDPANGPEATHHIAGGDIVDTAGYAHLGGEYYRHTPGGGPLSHTKFLLTSPELKDKREELGLDDATLARMGIKAETNKQPIERSEEYPHAVKSALAETGRKALGAILYPILAGINTLTQTDDKDVRNEVASQGAEGLAKRPVSERSYMIRRLCSGITGNADEKAILDILNASAQAGDLVQVVNVADAWKMAQAIDGDEYKQLRQILNEHYYKQTSQDMALNLIQRSMDGATSEWEEEMIADILVARADSDGRGIITRIGAIYSKGGFKEGFSKVQWQLDGADQRRVEAAYNYD